MSLVTSMTLIAAPGNPNPLINCESQSRQKLIKKAYEINKNYLNIKNPTVDVTKKHPLLLFEILVPRSLCTSQISVNKWITESSLIAH